MRFNGVKKGYLYVVQEKTQKHDTGYLKINVGDGLKKSFLNVGMISLART